jgi:predicted helicase
MKPILSNQFLETSNNLALLKEVEQKIISTIGLIYSAENEAQGNVCFANSSELRTEFRETFTAIDLQDYSYALLHSTEYKENFSELSKENLSLITIPTDRTDFWKLVQEGKELRLYLLENDILSVNKTAMKGN